MRRTTMILALALAGLPGVARADWPAEGVLLSTLASRSQDAVQMLRDSSSDVIIDWRRNNNSPNECVQRVTADGTLSPGWPAEAVRLNYEWLPHVCALDGSGGLYEVLSPSVAGVSLERTRGDAVQLPASDPWSWPLGNTTDQKVGPTIVSDGTGGSYAGWAGPFNGSGWYWVLSRQQSDGVAYPGWPTDGLPVSSSSPSNPTGPCLLRDPLGGVYVGWVSIRARLMRYDADGTAGTGWFATGLALAPTGPDTGKPIALAPSGSDHVIAMWYDTPTASAVARVLLRRIARDGMPDPTWPAGGVVLLNEPSSISSLGMAPDGLGGVWAWWEVAATPYVQHLQSDGTRAPGFAGPVSPLDAAALYMGGLFATRGRDDGLAVSWTDGRASRPGVRVRWLLGNGAADPAEPDSARVATPHYPPDFQGPVRAFGRGLLEDDQGGAYVAWELRSGPDWDFLYLGHLSRPSALGVTPGATPHAALTLRSVSPNPASGALAVRFTLASVSPARIELLDISGRRVRSLEVAANGAEQIARFEDLGRLPAGLYIVRLAQDGSARSARVAIVR